MSVRFELNEEGFVVTDLISVQAVDRSYFGSEVNGKKIHLHLEPEEALYLLDVRGAECIQKGKPISFNAAAKRFAGQKKFLARYFGYRDWRDRGLVVRSLSEAKGPYGKSPLQPYPAQEKSFPKTHADALFFPDDLMAVVDDNQVGEQLFEDNWFGQFGTYKAKKHGQFLKLDAYETLFLSKHASLKLDVSRKKVLQAAESRRPDFAALYDVYEDWRMRGFVPKTGFKFGTHFRLYFPGAAPSQSGQWMHSRHVIHVFSRDCKMLISEWARAIRVAHGVKKTFILAIPGEKITSSLSQLDFLLYHRKGDGIETPRKDHPSFAMLAFSEEEEIGGQELAEAISEAAALGLDLMLAICDRETAVTYYRVKRIDLPKSKFEYYEIEWVQP